MLRAASPASAPRTPGWAYALRAAAAAVLLAGLASQPAHALDITSLKSAIVYNLLLFVEWPPEVLPADGATLTLCVDGGGAAADPMLALAARPVGSRRLEVRAISGSPESLQGCHAWYRDAAAAAPGAAHRKQLMRGAVLTISNAVWRNDDATAIYLVELNGRLSFDVDVVTARQLRLQLSSKLLRLARKVYE